MQQNTIAVLRDAFLDNNQTAIAALGTELATSIKANSVGIDRYGIFSEFKYEEHRFKLRYIEAEHSYWMAEFLTTQNFYETVTGKNPNYLKGLDLPVGNVTYKDAITFCNKLNEYFQIIEMEFDLPSEEEWLAAKPYEYEGIDLKKNEELKRVAWFYKNSNGIIQPVGQKQSNINGLYDLLGNVWEWTITNYEIEGRKIIRGGSIVSSSDYLCRSISEGFPSWNKFNFLGFRIMLHHI